MEAQRFPISVRLIGVMLKDKSKMHMASVLWSDQSDVVIYRTFRDFKNIHKQMKKQFPAANKLNKSDRIIPKFRDNKIKQGRQRRGPTNSLARLKFLQKYCNELLSCDPRVCQCADLIRFFQPKDQDLQPQFSKNSIMIMPSDDEIANVGHGSSGSVTQPFVTETYRCVASYETKDTKNRPFKVAVDENVDVLIKDKAGWWLVENEENQIAWFPAPYLEKLDDDDDADEDNTNGTHERGMLYTAVKSYKASKDDEVTVTIGAVVEVLQKSDNGWWLIRYNGKAGYIPTTYLQPHNYPHVHLTAVHQNRRASATLQAPSSGLEQSQQLSRSQGNMLQLPPARSSSPHPPQPYNKLRSHSLDLLSVQPPAHPTASSSDTNISTSTTNAKYAPLPTIMVEIDGKEEKHGRSLAAVSDGSFASSSSDLSSSPESSSIKLSYSASSEQLHLSRMPSPMASSHHSLTNPEKKIILSVSDSNLYKGTKTPKVPPRPQAQEILTRCTTITRKNATRSNLPPETEILSR